VQRATVSRQQIIDELHARLDRETYVLAAWLGGSDATGRTDALSDIDLQVIVGDERVEDTISLVRAILEQLSPIEHTYRLPEPTPHGHAQIFCRLRDADPDHFLDLLVIRESAPDRFLERERHGDAVVLFDRHGLVAPAAMDWTRHRERMQSRLATMRSVFRLFQPLVTRGIRRGMPAESAQAYQIHTLRPLVELLRMRYCPERFDFGLRYLDRDLPREWRAEIERLAFPGPDTFLTLHRQAVAHFEAQLEDLDRGEWSVTGRTPVEGD